MRLETYAYARRFNPKARRLGVNIYTNCPACNGVSPTYKSGPLLVWERGESIRYKCSSCQAYGAAGASGPFAVR